MLVSTRTDVGAVPTWYEAVRPFAEPSVSGVDSKLGLTMVRPSLQSAPEPPALDPPQVSKHVSQMCGNFLTFLTSGDLDILLFNWKLALHLLVPWETFIAILIFHTFFLFSSYEPVWENGERQTECGRTLINALLKVSMNELNRLIVYEVYVTPASWTMLVTQLFLVSVSLFSTEIFEHAKVTAWSHKNSVTLQ